MFLCHLSKKERDRKNETIQHEYGSFSFKSHSNKKEKREEENPLFKSVIELYPKKKKRYRYRKKEEEVNPNK